MKKKWIIPLILGFVMICALLVILFLPKHEVDYHMAEKNTTSSQMEETIGSKPDSTTEENGMTIKTYDHSIYMDYTGKIDYYYLEDKLMMSRWETPCSNEEDIKSTYKDICANVTKELGKGTESDTKDFYTWTTDEKDVTVGYTNTEDRKSVYMVENQH